MQSYFNRNIWYFENFWKYSKNIENNDLNKGNTIAWKTKTDTQAIIQRRRNNIKKSNQAINPKLWESMHETNLNSIMNSDHWPMSKTVKENQNPFDWIKGLKCCVCVHLCNK